MLCPAPRIVDDARPVTPALLPILGLVLAVDAPAGAGTSARAAAAQPASPGQSVRGAGRAETALPAAKPGEKPPAPARSAAEAEEGEVLLRQKCAKCHELSLAWSSRLTNAQWRLHMRRMASRPGAAISDEQARKIHGALEEHRARSAKR